MKRFLYHIIVCAAAFAGICMTAGAENICTVTARTGGADGALNAGHENMLPQNPPASATGEDRYMQYIVDGKDTVYVDDLPAARVYEKLPRQKGREWRKYYRLVHNFSKVYPYALVARKLVAEVDSTIAADNLVRGRRDKYISRMQKELFDVFEKPMRSLTVSQGAMLMRLIDREVGKSKLFGTDLKRPYDPDGEDEPIEELVQKWENGEFEGLYYSLFWQYPPVIEIPSKYR